LKKENHQLFEKLKNQSINKSSEIVVSQGLKDKLSVARDMNGKVSLVNNDQVMIVECKGKLFDLDLKELSKCYVNKTFDYMLDLYDLNHHKDLMVELINDIPYHCYECEYDAECEIAYKLVFPLDLNHIKNIDIIIPGRYRIRIVNLNQFMVEKLNEECNSNNIELSTDGYNIDLKYGDKYNLQQLHGYPSFNKFLFAPGYASLEIYE